MDGDLDRRVLGRWDGERIVGVAVHRGSSVVALEAWIRGDTRVVRAPLGGDRSQWLEIWRSSTEGAGQLQAAGDVLGFVASGEWGKAGFLGDTPTSWMESHDGVHWTRERMDGKRVQSICMAREGRWVLGGHPLRLTFTPR